MDPEANENKTIFAHECHIRDLYAKRLGEFHPGQRLVTVEYGFAGLPESHLRADMRTVDTGGLRRMWEFKLQARYNALGQVLTYLSLARVEDAFENNIRAVIAAFDFQPEVEQAVEVLNLGIELVTIPSHLRLAGGIPSLPPPEIVHIPTFPKIIEESE